MSKNGESVRSDKAKAQWQRLMALFEEISELPSTQRNAVIDSKQIDQETREKLERMLNTLNHTVSLLDTPIADRIATSENWYADQWVGKKLNGYSLDRLLHAGSIAGVFLASQEEPVHRKVVIKMMRPEAPSDLINFFEFEQQSLARLSHPNIATIHTVEKSEDGLSFIVMEYIEGTVLSDYCDSHKLSIHRRLHLFLQICDAISYSHQRGILHRDLKSSNILVRDFEGKPTPTIIDFGISSDLEEKVQLDENNLLGTPEYMSPEHVLSINDLDARADVYSLGMVLFSLLAGRIPFDRGSIIKLDQAKRLALIAEFEAPPPGAYFDLLSVDEQAAAAQARGTSVRGLAGRLDIELDVIYGKATSKDREKRYSSVAELADDVRRHLDHQVVHAHPPSTLYRAKKFLRRNAIASAAALTILTLGTLFVVKLIDQNYEIKAEAQKALLEKRNAEEVTAMIMQTIGFADPTGASSEGVASAAEMLEHGYQNLLKTKGLGNSVRVDLMLSLSEAFRGIGDVEKAKEIDFTLVGDAKNFDAVQLCKVYLSAAETAEADAAFVMQLKFAQEAFANCSAGATQNARVIESKLAVAQAYMTNADFSRAREDAQMALSMYAEYVEPRTQLLADIYQSLGNIEAFTGHFDEAKVHFEKTVEITSELYSRDHAITVAAETKLLQLLCHVNDDACTLERIQGQLKTVARVRGEESSQVVHVLSILSHKFLNSGDYELAAETVSKNLAIMEKRGEQFQPRYLANRGNLFFNYFNSGNYAGALTVAEGTYRLATEPNEMGHELSSYRKGLAFQWYGRALFATGEPQHALEKITAAAGKFESIPSGNRSNVRKTRLIRALINAAGGELDEAKRDVEWVEDLSASEAPDAYEKLMHDCVAAYVALRMQWSDHEFQSLTARWEEYIAEDMNGDVSPPFSTIAAYLEQGGR